MARDDVGIVIGVYEDEVFGLGNFMRVLLGVGQLRAMQDDTCAVRTGLLNLVERGIRRHDDRRRYVEATRVERDALRVISCRHRDNSASSLFIVQSA